MLGHHDVGATISGCTAELSMRGSRGHILVRISLMALIGVPDLKLYRCDGLPVQIQTRVRSDTSAIESRQHRVFVAHQSLLNASHGPTPVIGRLIFTSARDQHYFEGASQGVQKKMQPHDRNKPRTYNSSAWHTAARRIRRDNFMPNFGHIRADPVLVGFDGYPQAREAVLHGLDIWAMVLKSSVSMKVEVD